MKSILCASSCLLLSLAVLAGCSGNGGLNLAKASGQVTYKSKPLVGASVKFYPTDGPMAVAITDDEGNFSVTTNGRPGALVGLHKVSITKMSDDSPAAQMPANPSPDDMRNMAMSQSGKKNSGPTSEIPEKYSVPDSSGLTADVVSDSSQNVFQFTLE